MARTILKIHKTKATPKRFPRKAGLPTKEPICQKFILSFLFLIVYDKRKWENYGKNKDKSHLIDQLYDYLEEQIQELKTDRNQLNHKMQDMIQEKNEKEGAINNQQKIYQIRKVFSPLPLEIEEEKQPVSEDMIQIEKEIHEFQMILREKKKR